MKIAEIRTHPLAIPLHGRYHWAIGAPEGFNAVLVEVHTDDGLVGYGDALGTRSADAAEATIRSVEHLLLGEDPFRVEYLLARMYLSGAWSNQRRFANQSFAGIEMALWDICGKALGQPVYNLLGGKIHESIHWFGFLQGGDPQTLAVDARQYVERGFDVLYMKIGQTVEFDIAAVRAVREAVGDGPRLRVDPNEAWDRHTAVTMIRRLAPFDLDWVEQPLPAGDIAGAADLRRQVSVPIALDQALFTDADVLARIIHKNAVSLCTTGCFALRQGWTQTTTNREVHRGWKLRRSPCPLQTFRARRSKPISTAARPPAMGASCFCDRRKPVQGS